MVRDDPFPGEFADIRSLVQHKLRETHPKQEENWTHVSGGCETGSSFDRSTRAYEGLGFHLKTLADVAGDEVDLSVDLLGAAWNLPIGIAPMSSAISTVCPGAFTELALGAKAAGIPAGIGYPNGPDIHSKMLETGAAVFRIVKPLKDIEKLIDTLQRTQDSGCFAAGIDMDSIAGLKPTGDTCHYEELCRPLSVAELREIRRSVDIPFIIKGILGVEDANSALEIGADAIVVSTHAGVSLDYCPSPLEVLPSIVKAVGSSMKILVDSGIRRGSDIVKALALGADAVLIGRMAVWGLVMGKGEGLQWILHLMVDEMRRILVLTGAGHLSELNAQSLVSLDHIGDRILSPLQEDCGERKGHS
jgi:4-hydroxymandelate oxidase